MIYRYFFIVFVESSKFLEQNGTFIFQISGFQIYETNELILKYLYFHDPFFLPSQQSLIFSSVVERIGIELKTKPSMS